MPKSKKILISLLLCICFLSSTPSFQPVMAKSDDLLPFIILSQYEATLNIGEEIYIMALTSNGKQANWKSSNSTVASVNTYGVVTAKKSGSAVVTAKMKDAETSCYITVRKTKVEISSSSISIERGETYRLSATASTNSPVTWTSSKKSVATVNEYGVVTALKPGETIITATADKTRTSCMVTVRFPTVQVSKSTATLYRNQTVRLSASVSSHVLPVWKTNKKSVAVVDANGTVSAIKNGTATITATVDGITATCVITVMKPDITLSTYEITLKKGNSTRINATVSSGNPVLWSSSNSNVVTIDSQGEINAKQKGKAYVYAAEDGTKVRCTVLVTD